MPCQRTARPANDLGKATVGAEIALSIALTTVVVLAAASLFIAGEALLPRVTVDSTHLSTLWPYAGAPVALLSVAAIVVLWIRRRMALDLWLMVVTAAICDRDTSQLLP